MIKQFLDLFKKKKYDYLVYVIVNESGEGAVFATDDYNEAVKLIEGKPYRICACPFGEGK